jgi:DNA-binding response OmpR family regulator
MRPKTLLCVDDDEAIRNLYAAILDRHGYEVLLACDGWQALRMLYARAHEVDAVILDYQMPGLNGAQLAAEVKRRSPLMPVILISGDMDIVESPPPHTDATLEKGVPVSIILEKVEALIGTIGIPKERIAFPAYTPLGSA